MPTDDLDRFCCQNPDCASLRPAGRRQPLGLRPLRQGPPPAALLQRLQGPVLRVQGDAAVQLQAPARQGPGGPGAPRRGLRRPPDRPAGGGQQGHGHAAGPAGRSSTPRPPTTSWWPFPPETREVQFDEKWAFVGKKQKNCDPADPDDDHCGDYWDHVAFDPEHKLVLAVVPGARTEENARAIVAEVKQRLGRRPAAVDDQRRVPGVRDGDRGGLQRAGARPAASASRAGRGSCPSGGCRTA